MSESGRFYYYRVRGRTLGPFDIQKMQVAAARGALNKNTDVSFDGLSWTKASDCPEIFLRDGGGNGGPTPGKSDKWFYSSNGQAVECSLSDLQQMVARGSLGPTDHVIRNGMESWAAVDDLPELRAYIPKPAVVTVGTQVPDGNGVNSVFCRECGTKLNRRTVICPTCGVPTETTDSNPIPIEAVKHSGPGIASFIMSLVSALFLFVLSSIAAALVAEDPDAAYSPRGQVVGILMLVFLFVVLVAMGLGIGGLFQKSRKKIYAVVGTVLSGCILGGALLLVLISSSGAF